jgi:hypothetical protein
MIRILFILCFAIGILHAERFVVLNSERARLANKTMVLDGGVQLDTSMGKATAEHAEMLPSGKAGILTGNVRIVFVGGEELSCDAAKLDFDRMEAEFTCDQEEAGVIYTKFPTFTLRSNSMLVAFSQKLAGASVDHGIVTINANGGVRVDMINGGCLTADKALYDKTQNEVAFFSDDPEKPFCYRDDQGTIYAQSARLNVETQDCLLEGNVKMIHRKGPLEQYALADKVEISKNRGEAHFYAINKQRVLFYDKVNRLQVSAPELTMKRDSLNNKDQIKGIGNVRFHFMEKEYDRLRNHFLFDKEII